MNIFVLDTDPIKAAHMHCDQHLNKMILESAQMLSVALKHWIPNVYQFNTYAETHANHPCNLWLKRVRNVSWLVKLTRELNNIREFTYNRATHQSMEIIEGCAAFLLIKGQVHIEYANPTEFEFCGPLQYKLRSDLSVPQKYQLYYREKYRQWLDTKRPMSYKNRPIPAFLADLPYIEGIR